MTKRIVKTWKKAVITAMLLGCTLLFASCQKKKTGGEEDNTLPSFDSSNNQEDNSAEGGDIVEQGEVSQQLLALQEQAKTNITSASEEVKRSLLSTGNNARMKKVIERMSNGEDITVAYIGGSITEGYLVNSTQNYAIKATKQLRELFQNENIKNVNAGLSGTSSTIGLLRVNDDVLVNKPDVVFVEFAVNDGQDITNKFAYESLVRELYDSETHPAVVLIFTVLQNGYTCQEQMMKVGETYGLPMISVGDAINPLLKDGTLSWSEYAQDEAHPNNAGHTRIASYIDYYYQTVLASTLDEEVSLADVKEYGYPYAGMTFYTKDNLYPEEMGSFAEGGANIEHFPNGWVWTRGGTESMKFRMSGRNLFLLYKEVNADTQGCVEVWIDGKKQQTVNGYSTSGWNNPQVALVLNEVTAGDHEVEIKVKDGDEDKNFAILGFGTSGTITSATRVTEDMIPYTDRAVLNTGNTYRLSKLFERAKAGEKLTIGFIGGSITMGSGASDSDHCYAKLVYDWWCKTFPDAEFTFVNAGIGATTSEFGCARVDSDLLSYKPDFVVVEFSVNDESTSVYEDSYESLVRKILLSETEPAVLVLNMVQYDSGYNVQNMHNKIAFTYNLPVISMSDSIYKEILYKKLAATDVSQDMLHPNDRGHAYAAEIVTTYLDKLTQSLDGSNDSKLEADASYSVPDALTPLLNLNAVRYDSRNSSPDLKGFIKDDAKQSDITDIFKNGWTGKKTGDSITFKITGTSIALQYRKTNALGAPKAVVTIDGDESKAVALDGNYPNGWGNWLYLHDIASNLSDGEHTVTIKITEDGEKDFYLVSVIGR